MMAVFKRTIGGKKGRKYYMKFMLDGKQYLKSCRTTNLQVAQARERSFRTMLENRPSAVFGQIPRADSLTLATPAPSFPVMPAPLPMAAVPTALTLRAFIEVPDLKNQDPLKQVGGVW